MLAVVFFFYLLGCFPGVMTTDSLYQWREFITHKYYSWHPVAYSLFQYICTRIWYSPASVVIAQAVTLISIFIYGINTLIKIGVKKKILLITIILFALYPANGFMTITLWKDIIYSSMLLWMTIMLINILNTEGMWIKKKCNIGAFLICSMGILFFRYNGILTICAIMLALILLYRSYYKILTAMFVGLVAAYFIAMGPISNSAGVVKIPNAEELGIPMQQVAAVIHFDGRLTDKQKVFFNNILPLETWKEKYDPYTTNPLKFDKQFNVGFIVKHKKEFVNNWINVMINNPIITTKAYLRHTSIVWKIIPFRGAYTYTASLGIEENEFGIHSITISSLVTNIIRKIFDFTNNPIPLILFWRPALWLYISVLSGITLKLKYKLKALLVLVPLVSNAAAFMVATPSQDFRYQYGNVLIGFILLPLAFQVLHSKFNNTNEI